MGVPSGRGPPEPAPPETAIVRQAEPEPDLFPSRDFRITDALRIGEGSLRDKALDNIEAIRALKRIDAESRAPTDAEKSLLVKYTGWGAMANAFRPFPPPEWQHTATELRELLTPPEYDSARASTPNAHYTSPAVIKSVWQAMQRFGLRPGAQILEPSMGIGHFFGLMPDELLTGTRRTGVELDSVTARIAKCLYPDSTVFAKGFEDTPLPDNFFDAVIGNIPFGNYAVHDPAYRRTPALTRTIHDYFLAKSLDKVRPGGVLALITSRYTMDKQDATIRRHLAERADLIAAIRLKALHNLDAPWRPRDIEQRDGRGLRQGNLNSEIDIYRYVTEGSFDGYSWQTLETKARFIQQVMSGQTSVRTADDLEGGALTYAEIKAIASGNPAVMEKVKVDTEIRKLDQLRSAHLNQQHNIRWQIRNLPETIAEAHKTLANVQEDIATRDAHEGEEFSMFVGMREFSGKGAREEAAKALTYAVLSWREDLTLQPRGYFRGFSILSRGKRLTGLALDGEPVPELFIKGKSLYSANLNPENPLGTMQSIEHALRSLDKLADHEQERGLRLEKNLADYQAQANKPFDHEARMKDLLVRQTKLNAALDLDKGERQAAEMANDDLESSAQLPATGVPAPAPIRRAPPALGY